MGFVTVHIRGHVEGSGSRLQVEDGCGAFKIQPHSLCFVSTEALTALADDGKRLLGTRR